MQLQKHRQKLSDNTLESDGIKLRAVEPSDIDVLYQWENNMEIWQVSNTLAPFSRYALKRYIQNAQLDIYQTKQLRLIIETKGNSPTPVGMIDLFDFDPFNQRAGVGILIANTSDRQKGIATESLKILINYAFNTLGLNQLYCDISSSNTSSLQLFKNCGFSSIGTKKNWLKTGNGWDDVIMFQLLKK